MTDEHRGQSPVLVTSRVGRVQCWRPRQWRGLAIDPKEKNEMKRIRLLGLALIALIALGAYASASAFAEDPTILPVPTAGEPASFTAESTGTLTFVGIKEGNEVQCPKF